jgi:hypothetical protein
MIDLSERQLQEVSSSWRTLSQVADFRPVAGSRLCASASPIWPRETPPPTVAQSRSPKRDLRRVGRIASWLRHTLTRCLQHRIFVKQPLQEPRISFHGCAFQVTNFSHSRQLPIQCENGGGDVGGHVRDRQAAGEGGDPGGLGGLMAWPLDNRKSAALRAGCDVGEARSYPRCSQRRPGSVSARVAHSSAGLDRAFMTGVHRQVVP